VPIYEYECARCEKRFEYMEKMGASGRKKCEACGGKLERLISAAGFHLKGTGWYKTDYASKSAPPPASSSGKKGTDKKD
jgi:putative FmdB family regulatory protein